MREDGPMVAENEIVGGIFDTDFMVGQLFLLHVDCYEGT